MTNLSKGSKADPHKGGDCNLLHMFSRPFSIARGMLLSCLLPLAFVMRTQSAESSIAALPQPAWGRMTSATHSAGRIQLEVRFWPTDGRLPLPTPFPNITAAHLVNGVKKDPLKWAVNTDATELHLEVPAQVP